MSFRPLSRIGAGEGTAAARFETVHSGVEPAIKQVGLVHAHHPVRQKPRPKGQRVVTHRFRLLHNIEPEPKRAHKGVHFHKTAVEEVEAGAGALKADRLSAHVVIQLGLAPHHRAHLVFTLRLY